MCAWGSRERGQPLSSPHAAAVQAWSGSLRLPPAVPVALGRSLHSHSAGWPGALGAAALVVAPSLPMLSRDGAVLGLLECAVSFQLKVIIRKDCFPIIDL